MPQIEISDSHSRCSNGTPSRWWIPATQLSSSSATLSKPACATAKPASHGGRHACQTPFPSPSSVKSYSVTRNRAMPLIEISDTTLALLKRHAEPLVDTCDTVILKFGQVFEASLSDGQNGVPP